MPAERPPLSPEKAGPEPAGVAQYNADTRMGGVWFEIVIIVLLVLANGVFSMAEIAVVAARKVRLQQRAEEGDHRAKVALELAQSPAQFLSTVQVGITLIGILAGAYGGATISEPLASIISRSVSSIAPLCAPSTRMLRISSSVTA